MTIAHNEEETIGATLKNWDGFDHYVFISNKPWHSFSAKIDNTEQIALDNNAIVIKGNWKSEAQQRNWALGHLYSYDYVLIIDADELYTEEDKRTIYKALEEGVEDGVGRIEHPDVIRTDKMLTYWKTTDYVFDPPDKHKPIIAVNPKKVLFTEHRQVDVQYQPIIPVTLHHLSYCKTDKKIFEKIHQFEHCNDIKKDWFNNVWKNWEIKMEDIRPYGEEVSMAKHKPLPEELKNLI